jgi:hypothetical protein
MARDSTGKFAPASTIADEITDEEATRMAWARVNDWTAWRDNGGRGVEPVKPSLQVLGFLPWPANVIEAARIHGYHGTMFDEPESRFI